MQAARRARLSAYDQWRPFVDAGPVRDHLHTLRRAGIGRRRIAELAGISQSVLANLLYGKSGRVPTRRVRPQTASAILAIQPNSGALAPSTPVDATGSRRRLQALVAVGWNQSQLAARLGMTRGNFGSLMRRGQVTAHTEQAVSRLYDQLWDQAPTTDTPRTATIAEQARNYARARGWPPPLAWDDDIIDDPAAMPAADWRRTRRTLTTAALAEDAAELLSQGGARQNAAERLGVTPGAIEKAFARTREATSTFTHKDGATMPFDPTPKPASEYQRGIAFGAAMVMRQVDAGMPADRIQETQDAAKLTLVAAARNDGEREFCAGYSAAVDTRLATLRDIQRAEAYQLRWEREQEAEHEPEREAG